MPHAASWALMWMYSLHSYVTELSSGNCPLHSAVFSRAFSLCARNTLMLIHAGEWRKTDDGGKSIGSTMQETLLLLHMIAIAMSFTICGWHGAIHLGRQLILIKLQLVELGSPAVAVLHNHYLKASASVLSPASLFVLTQTPEGFFNVKNKVAKINSAPMFPTANP